MAAMFITSTLAFFAAGWFWGHNTRRPTLVLQIDAESGAAYRRNHPTSAPTPLVDWEKEGWA